MWKVAYLGGDPGFEATVGALKGSADVTRIQLNPISVAEALIDADALLDASMKVHVTDAMIRSANNLKIISCATTGSDHIDTSELEARGIPIRTLKDDPEFLQNITPAAELSWALLMACARNLCGAVTHTKSGKWVREEFPGAMLNGKKLGLIGCGRIGSWMARYGRAFGMSVSAFDPGRKSFPVGVESATLEHLMKDSDFISVHVHLTSLTKGLVHSGLFSVVKPGAIFINTSRGAIVDEKAMLGALESGRLGGAGLDVLDGEPNIDSHPLIRYSQRRDNLIITPHCGGYSPDAVLKVTDLAARKILSTLTNF